MTWAPCNARCHGHFLRLTFTLIIENGALLKIIKMADKKRPALLYCNIIDMFFEYFIVIYVSVI
jgi:hypothetical protein